MKKLKGITRTLVCIGVFIAVAACESTDCPINNIVYSTYGFYAATDEGESKIQVLDTLTITAAGTDSILINRTRRDTIWIDKEIIPHYESPTCPASMFHHVTAVRWTRLLVDSVSIVNPNINYNVSENFKIYFRSGN